MNYIQTRILSSLLAAADFVYVLIRYLMLLIHRALLASAAWYFDCAIVAAAIHDGSECIDITSEYKKIFHLRKINTNLVKSRFKTAAGYHLILLFRQGSTIYKSIIDIDNNIVINTGKKICFGSLNIDNISCEKFT